MDLEAESPVLREEEVTTSSSNAEISNDRNAGDKQHHTSQSDPDPVVPCVNKTEKRGSDLKSSHRVNAGEANADSVKEHVSASSALNQESESVKPAAAVGKSDDEDDDADSELTK